MVDVPVYIFTGFLESGKTTFLLSVLKDQGFTEGDRCLIIACEEGLVEYDEEELKALNCHVAYIESKEDFNTQTMRELDQKYRPQVVMIEFNGTWSLIQVINDTAFPKAWALAQIVSTVDASTFSNYLSNMRSIMYEQLVDSDMIVFNRCSEKTKKSFLRSNIKAINRVAQIVYESVDGSVNNLPEDDLPFDKKADYLDIKEDDYGLWYMDALEHPEDYQGKTVKVKGKAYEPMDDGLHDQAFVLARKALVCCSDDTQAIGFLCYFDHAAQLYDQEWCEVEATVGVVYDEDYGKNVPVLRTKTLKVVPPMKDETVYFS